MTAIIYKKIHPKNRQQWRDWLQQHHQSSPGVWMVFYKKATGKLKLSYAEAVEEVLCFGWIDSIKQVLDDQRSIQKFTPRKTKSVWSKLNKTRILKLIEQKLMTSAGIEKIELAKANGSWQALDNSTAHADNNTIPAELAAAFQKNKKALANSPLSRPPIAFAFFPGSIVPNR